MTQRTDCLTRNRDAINNYIDVVSDTITASTDTGATYSPSGLAENAPAWWRRAQVRRC